MISLKLAKYYMEYLRINPAVIDPRIFQYAMNVEMEHGKLRSDLDVIHGNLLVCAKIALAHLEEFPDYYEELKKMEHRLDRKWAGKRKPSVTL